MKSKLWSTSFALWALATAQPAHCQVHEQNFEGYRIVATTLKADAIPVETARRNAIEPGSKVALIDVAVRRRNGDKIGEAVPAVVKMTATDKSGQKVSLSLKEVNESGTVSYLSKYQFVSPDIAYFDITAQPKGSTKTLTMRFEEQYVPR